MERDGIRSKKWVTRSGRTIGGGILLRGALYALLSNPIYTGKVRHRGKMYDGQQGPILAQELWTAVQQQLDAHRAARMPGPNSHSSCLLAGCVFDRVAIRLSSTMKTSGGNDITIMCPHVC